MTYQTQITRLLSMNDSEFRRWAIDSFSVMKNRAVGNNMDLIALEIKDIAKLFVYRYERGSQQ